MAKRIYRSTFFLVFITLLLCIVLLSGSLYSYSKEQVFNVLKQSSIYIEKGIQNEGTSYLNSIPRGKDRITLIAEDGKVVYDSIADASTMENHSDREEFIDALSEGEGRSIRNSSTLNQETLYYAKKIDGNYVLRVSATNRTVVALLKQILNYNIFISFVSLCLAAILSRKLVHYIMKPINMIDPEYPEDCDTYEELNPLISKLHEQNKRMKAQMNMLSQKQKEFKNITENMSEGFIVLDVNKRVLSHNQSAVDLLSDGGLSENPSIFSFNRSEGFRKTIDKALDGEKAKEIISVNRRQLQVLADPVKEENKVAGAILVIMDFTEQLEWENLRREFTANVSHELKTPLTSIAGISEILKNGMVKQKDVVHFADNIYKEAKRMISLINDTIRLSELDEGDVSGEWSEIDLLELVKDVCEQLADAACSQKIRFEIGENGALIQGVYKIAWEMVYNLVDNAIKYNKEGGLVKIEIIESDNDVALLVADTGIGIEAKDQDRVFERFYRADKSHSKNIEGTGLGLSIVKHGAKFHNARVQLKSEIQKGTTISIEWPKI
ncbi:MAG: histidine kinase [Clostridia bacterium]|nr:histidine kinase [Clostridia bacterium]